ncbi:MAG: hypothetical protein AAGJ70_03970 [Pseudomonadota bacterium]
MSDITRHGTVLLTWLVAWPVVTVLVRLIDPLLADVGLPVRTLILTAILVPVMSNVAMPAVTALVELLNIRARGARKRKHENTTAAEPARQVERRLCQLSVIRLPTNGSSR